MITNDLATTLDHRTGRLDARDYQADYGLEHAENTTSTQSDSRNPKPTLLRDETGHSTFRPHLAHRSGRLSFLLLRLLPGTLKHLKGTG